jgi:hypothetical protein
MSHIQRLRRVATSPRAVALTLCLGVHGCNDVSGGAVELSWKLRGTAGSTETFLTCEIDRPGTGNIEKIRLDWNVDGVAASREWPCDDGHGTTGFELPEGTALLQVSPVCAMHDAAPDTYTAPAPEQRTVIAGNTISLGGVELLLEVSSCDQQACICQ